MAGDDHAILRVFFVSVREIIQISFSHSVVLVPETLVNKAFFTEARLDMGKIKIVYPILHAICASES